MVDPIDLNQQLLCHIYSREKKINEYRDLLKKLKTLGNTNFSAHASSFILRECNINRPADLQW
jgi:hypothetical protein